MQAEAIKRFIGQEEGTMWDMPSQPMGFLRWISRPVYLLDAVLSPVSPVLSQDSGDLGLDGPRRPRGRRSTDLPVVFDTSDS